MLNAIDVVNAEAGLVRDLTVIVSTRTIFQAIAKAPKELEVSVESVYY